MNDDDVCERCGKVVIDHTLREMRSCHPAQDLNLGFEESAIGQQDLSTQQAGGLVVMAATIPTAYGTFPALVFRFVKANGIDFFPDMTLVLDETAMRNTGALVQHSVSSAIKATKL